MTIEPLGDSALIVRLTIEPEADPARMIGIVQRVAATIRDARVQGVMDVVPAYATVGVFFDPVTTFEMLQSHIAALLASPKNPRLDRVTRLIEIPICYDGEFAIDLSRVAQHASLSPEEVIIRHSEGEYFVHCIGFTPGFPYLSGLPRELSTPRLESPRVSVPAGAVAIGGNQTGIYPQQTPGGWNVIGRTPIPLFDVAANPPALLAAGDRVSFRRIERNDFNRLSG